MKRIILICAVIVMIFVTSLPCFCAQTESIIRLDLEIELNERRGSLLQQYISFDIGDRVLPYSTYDLSSVLNLGNTKEYKYYWTREAVTLGQRFQNYMYYYFNVLALESGSFVFQVNMPTMYGAQGSNEITLQVKDRYDNWVDYETVGGALTVTYTRTDFTYNYQDPITAYETNYSLYQYAIAGSFDSTSDYTEFRFVCPFYLYYPANWTEFWQDGVPNQLSFAEANLYGSYNTFILPYDDGAMTYYYDMTEATAKATEITAKNSEAIKNNTGVIASNSNVIVNNTQTIIELIGEVDSEAIEEIDKTIESYDTVIVDVEEAESELIESADSVLEDIDTFEYPEEYTEFVNDTWADIFNKFISIPNLVVIFGIIIIIAIVSYIIFGKG